jgi:hypothetical protein
MTSRRKEATVTKQQGKPSARHQVRDTIIALAHDETSGWAPVPGIGLTIRHTEEHDTPEAIRAKPGERSGFGTWDQPTYHSHVFVTLIAHKVILGYGAAPWVGRNDSEIPLWLALAILGDHTLAGDYERINAMRTARKAARPAAGG